MFYIPKPTVDDIRKDKRKTKGVESGVVLYIDEFVILLLGYARDRTDTNGMQETKNLIIPNQYP